MAQGSLRILRAIPGSTAHGPIVRDFCRPGHGVITALTDAALPLCRAEVDEDSLVEVLSFGDLVRRMLEMSGEEALRIAPQSHSLAAISQACTELPSDSPFRKSCRFPGLSDALLSTLHELNGWGLFSEQMDELAEAAEGRLAAKLRSLAMLDKESRRLLNLLGLETHARQLASSLEATPEKDGSFERLLCFVGSEETPLKLHWLKWAADHGVDVTLVMDRHATGGRVFHGVERALGLVPGRVVEIGDGNRLLRNLFSDHEHEGAALDVVISSAADPLAEVEWALRRVLESAEPSRCSIYARNLATYAPLLEAASVRLGVPIRMARRAPLLTNSLARLTLSALEFLVSDDVRTIRPLLQSSYLGLDRDEQTAAASGLLECHRTRNLQWLTMRTWAELNEERFGWLVKLLEWRHTNMSSGQTLSGWAPRLMELIDKVLPVLQNAEAGVEYSQERDRRARNQMQRTLAGEASIANACGGGTLSLHEFVTLCGRLWESADVSIPPGEVGVHVTAVPESLEDGDLLVVLGMLEGFFPRRRSEDPILTDSERQALSALRPGEPRLRSSVDVAEEERDAFYRVCAHANRTLVFSYPQSDDSRDNVPAFYLELVKKAQGTVQEFDHPRSLLAPLAEEAKCAADIALREALDGPRELPPEIGLRTEAVRQLLVGDERGWEPSALQDALQCPFRFLARHRLRLWPKRTSARWSTLRNLPQMASLAKQTDPATAEKALLEALEAHLDALYSEIPGWEMQLLRSGGRRLAAEWVRREFVARKIWPKKDGSLILNAGFGTHGTRDVLWNKLPVAGVIPALSEIGQTKVAHLYASSVPDVRSIDEAFRMYLGIYLGALYEQGKESAVEIETMDGNRYLYRLTRTGAPALTTRQQEGVEVVMLSEVDDASTAKRIYFEEVKRLVGQAAAKIRQGSVETRSGDHCEFCDYGELCRRSQGFGEDDSPFAEQSEGSDD